MLRICLFLCLGICLFSACRVLHKERVDVAYLMLYADSSQLSGVYVLDCHSSQKAKGGRQFYVNGTAIGLFSIENEQLKLSESADSTAFSQLCGRVVFDCTGCACTGMPPCDIYETAHRSFGRVDDQRRAFHAHIPSTKFTIDSFSADKSRIYVAKAALQNRLSSSRTLTVNFPKQGAIFYLARPSSKERQALHRSLGGDCEFRACEHCPLPSIDSIARTLQRLR